jgi:hypothetical protein
MTAFPLTGPHRALGHASNVVRRNAAHSCGKHATPAVIITVNRHGFQQSHAHPGMDIRPTTPRCHRQIVSVESTESTVKNRCPDSASPG